MNLESYVAHERRQTEQLEARGFVQPPPTGFVHERSSLAKLSCACGKRAISGDTAASKSATAAEANNKELAAAGDAPDGGAACTATATARRTHGWARRTATTSVVGHSTPYMALRYRQAHKTHRTSSLAS